MNGLVRIVSCLAVCASGATAQVREFPLPRWQHTTWTASPGVPPFVSDGMQRSNDGYLWIAAPWGLLRFDGVAFSRFDSTTTPELRSGGRCCYSLHKSGPSGTMWITGPNGLLVAYRDGRFRIELPVGSGRTGAVVEDRLGRLWGQADSLVLIRNGRFESPPLPSGVPDRDLAGIEPDSGAGIWIGTRREGLWHVNGDSVEHFGTGWLRALLQTRDGTVWTVGTGNTMPRIGRLHGGVWTALALPDGARPVARSAVEGPDGSVWFPTGSDGVLRWKDGQLEQFSATEGLSSESTQQVHVSDEGAVWVLTEQGLDRLRSGELAYLDPNLHVRGQDFFVGRTGDLWISNGDGPLVQLTGGLVANRTGPVTRIDHALPDRFLPYRPSSLAPDDGFWIAPEGGGMVRILDRAVRILGPPQGLPRVRVNNSVTTRDGTLWMYLFEGEFGRVRNGRYRKLQWPGIGGIRGRSYAEDGLGRLWVGVFDPEGLVAIAGDSIAVHLTLPGSAPPAIVSMAAEGGDTLWAVSEEMVYRVAGGRLSAIPIPLLLPILEGVASVTIGRGQLWLASKTGIARVPLAELHRFADGIPGTVTPVILDALDGIPTPRTPGSLLHPVRTGPDGRVWILTTGGLAVADGPRPFINRIPPTPHIDGIVLDGARIPSAEHVRIGPRPGRAEFLISVPNLGIPERMRVEYRLEGTGEGWTHASPPYAASYDKLRPGRYRLRVRAWNESGVAGLEEATLAFLVLAAWYESWWFQLLCVLGIAGLGAVAGLLLQRRRTERTVANAQARFDAILDERTRLARELHDTLFQGFTGITLQIDGVRDALQEESRPLADSLSQILRRADQTLREARELVWDMRQPGLVDADLAEALRKASADLPNPGGMEITTVVAGWSRALPPNVATTCYRVGKEAIVNALTHSGGRTVEVTLTFEAHGVRLEVVDDGRGCIPEAYEGATARGHWGVAGMRERVRNVGGSLAIDSAPGRGTRVTISLPAEPVG